MRKLTETQVATLNVLRNEADGKPLGARVNYTPATLRKLVDLGLVEYRSVGSGCRKATISDAGRAVLA